MKYLIWSIEHGSWWRPARHGYTTIKEKAGRYSLEEATQIVVDANKFVDPKEPPHEAIVPIEE